MKNIIGNIASSRNETILLTQGYGAFFDGTNDNYGIDKLTAGDFSSFGINAITFNLTKVYKNNILIFNGYTQYNAALESADFSFRDDGYGLAPSTYIDITNNILQSYNFATRFYTNLRCIVNTKENFEIVFEEFAEGIDVPTLYTIKAVFGVVSDNVSDYNEITWS